jgi:prepilin-type N-terminal cleavage/methylation domain-containing protein
MFFSNRSSRQGLTLIELVVVMTILVALGGLLIPTFAAMLTRGHTSTCATNMGEVNKAVQQYQYLYGGYPGNMDALSDTTSTLVNYLAGGVDLPAANGGPGSLTSEGGGQITAINNLSAAEVTALQNAGITQVQKMVPDGTPGTAPVGFDPTFNYYPDATAAADTVTITTSTVLGGLDPGKNTAAATRCQQMNLPTTGRYVVLGIGSRCNMVGTTMQSAPVHFGDTPALNPEFGYERICAIFKISDTAIANFTTAILVAVAPIHNDGVGSISDELQNWYQLQQNGT